MQTAITIIVVLLLVSPFILILGILSIGASIVFKNWLYCKKNGHTWKTIYIDAWWGGFKTTCEKCGKEKK